MSNQKHLNFLDGLRAVSVVFVIVEHATVSASPRYTGFWKAFLANGHLGVSIFFVISGYLITNILLQDLQQNGFISLKSFWARRAWRLYPVLYFYLAVILILNLAGYLKNKPVEIIAAALFSWNYLGVFVQKTADQWYLGHFWSLALEQQFYLLWPIVLTRCGKKRAIFIATSAVLAMPFVRVCVYFAFPDQRGYIGMMFHTAADAVLMGCLLRLWQPWLIPFLSRHKRLFQFFVALVPVIVFVISPWMVSRFHGAYSLPIGMTLEALSAVMVISYVLITPQSPCAKFLELPWLRHVGVISYSIYVWQQLFLGRSLFAQYFGAGIGILLAFCCAELSFRFVEQPLRAWGKRRFLNKKANVEEKTEIVPMIK